jgi:hypothetical protein
VEGSGERGNDPWGPLKCWKPLKSGLHIDGFSSSTQCRGVRSPLLSCCDAVSSVLRLLISDS